MDSFKEKLLRLKNELKISTDKEVAAALGMKPTAFAERKKTNSFPDKQLFDIEYILLGHRRETYEAIEQEMLKDMPKTDLSDKTGLLVQLFMQCDDQGRAAILSVAQTMAAMGQTAGTTNISQQFNNSNISGSNFTVKNNK